MISHILESLYLICKLVEGFGAKTVFSCKNWPLNCQNSNTLYRLPYFTSIFLKINFSLISYDIINKIMSWVQCPISKLFAPKWSWKSSNLENSKKSILIFWDNWSLSMCWDTYEKHVISPCTCISVGTWLEMGKKLAEKYLFDTELNNLSGYGEITFKWNICCN